MSNEVQELATENKTFSDAELVADLAGRLEELEILVHDLEVSRPSIVLSFVALLVSVILLLGTLALVASPYLFPTFPQLLSTIAAFLSVVFFYVLYVATRRFSAEVERQRLHRSVLKRADYLRKTAADVMVEAKNYLTDSEA